MSGSDRPWRRVGRAAVCLCSAFTIAAAHPARPASAAEGGEIHVVTELTCPGEERGESALVALLVAAVALAATEAAKGFFSSWGKYAAEAAQDWVEAQTKPPDFSETQSVGAELFKAGSDGRDTLRLGCVIVAVGPTLAQGAPFDPKAFLTAGPPFNSADFQGVARRLKLAAPPKLYAALSVVDREEEETCAAGGGRADPVAGFQFAPATIWFGDKLSEQSSADGLYDLSIALEMQARYSRADAEESGKSFGLGAFAWENLEPGRVQGGEPSKCSGWFVPPAPAAEAKPAADQAYGPVDLTVTIVQGGEPMTLVDAVSKAVGEAMSALPR
jgi:hypothetical protein